MLSMTHHCFADLALRTGPGTTAPEIQVQLGIRRRIGSGKNAVVIRATDRLAIRMTIQGADGFLAYACLLAEGVPRSAARHTSAIHDMVLTADGQIVCLVERLRTTRGRTEAAIGRLIADLIDGIGDEKRIQVMLDTMPADTRAVYSSALQAAVFVLSRLASFWTRSPIFDMTPKNFMVGASTLAVGGPCYSHIGTSIGRNIS